jgi:hypothetical protein
MAGDVVRIGSKAVLQSEAASRHYSVVFEDDGDTGYFYALAPGAEALELLDALHVYNAEAELRGVDCTIELLWSADGSKAGLRLNAALWAVFDFERHKGWCRSEFPPPQGRWQGGEREPWDPALIAQF